MLIAPNIGRSSKHKLAKVNSRLKNLIANFGCQFFVVYTALGAFGFTLLSGTYFTAVLYKDFAVVAIDSRASDIIGVTPPDDRYCKITPISDELITHPPLRPTNFRHKHVSKLIPPGIASKLPLGERYSLLGQRTSRPR
jgi:hypothetical protein